MKIEGTVEHQKKKIKRKEKIYLDIVMALESIMLFLMEKKGSI